jgi:hypothetical protein
VDTNVLGVMLCCKEVSTGTSGSTRAPTYIITRVVASCWRAKHQLADVAAAQGHKEVQHLLHCMLYIVTRCMLGSHIWS